MSRKPVRLLVPTLTLALVVASLAPGCVGLSKTFERAISGDAAAAPTVDPSTIPCPLSRRDELFVDQLLSLWRETLHEDLKLGPRPLPWTVLIGRQCVYQLNPRGPLEGGKNLTTALVWSTGPLVVHATGHAGHVTLPDGKTLPLGAHSYATRAGDHDVLVLSLMELWAAHPHVGKLENAAEVVLGLALHELAHTTHAKNLEGQPRALDPQLVQRTFANNEEYVRSYRQEADTLWAAALASDDETRRRLAAEALGLAKQRRARFFVGEHADLARVEGAMLGHEGIGEWVRVRLMTRAKALPENRELLSKEPLFTGWQTFEAMDERAVLELAHEQTKAGWTQESGLALILVLDEVAPDWRARLLASPPADPYLVLEEALARAP